MAHPKRRHSHSRTRKRRTHQKVSKPLLVECSQCRKLKVAHMVCPFCGYYAGREVIKIERKKKERKKIR
jgi:large subunit ribosomal protein L32